MKAPSVLVAALALRDMLAHADVVEQPEEIGVTENPETNEITLSVPRFSTPVTILVSPYGGYWRYPDDICFFVNWYGPDMPDGSQRAFQCNMGTDSIYRALIDVGHCMQSESDNQLYMREKFGDRVFATVKE
jgi:hypothetical protein